MGQYLTIDGNEAVARVAFKLNEVIAIYPITPSSPMGEWADMWSSRGQRNLWGTTPLVQEMQAEGGAAGAVHGSLQTGSLTTTFTASQGLLLMIPNMYKIAGELTPTVFHIAARSIAAQGLSIFGDHSDVMATRSTGWAMLFANSVQEAQDMALIAQAATLKSRIPFMHVMDGFRTSHEVSKIEVLEDKVLSKLIDSDLVREHRLRGLSPDRPFIRGTAQNPDVFFQARESSNLFYGRVADIVKEYMEMFAAETGREYKLFEYHGAKDAETVIVMMGSGAEAAEETVNHMQKDGKKVGLLKVRLYRPFSVDYFLKALPKTVKTLVALDRTKEPGSAGEPLYQDIVTAITEQKDKYGDIRVLGGRYGLSSKEFTPAMVMAVFENGAAEKAKNHFTIGINDDLSHTSLDYDKSIDIESDKVTSAVFWGLGSDGTVGANKNSIKIIGEGTDNYAQGYFVYDSKKSGARTISHLRFGPDKILSTYLIRNANFVAVHQFGFLDRYDVLATANDGATLLINSPFEIDKVWGELPKEVQKKIISKKIELYAINAYDVAKSIGLGNRINTIMQTCFFAISGVLEKDEAIVKIKEAIKKTYGKRGEAVVRMNYAAVDATLEHLHKVEIKKADSKKTMQAVVPSDSPDFVQNVLAPMMLGDGDDLRVSELPNDGTYPSATTKYEKRNISLEAPVWDPEVCIQCGKCVLVCPHAVIRSTIAEKDAFEDAPEGFMHVPARFVGLQDQEYTLQISAEDCTGCTLCVEVCPAKNKSVAGKKAINMEPVLPIKEKARKDWEFFLTLPEVSRIEEMKFNNVKNVQLLEPLFEFSGACAGCGETPYLKLISQLFGDRSIIANATGCSSIYGGNLPTTPWAKNSAGRGPAWSNSLFEDNAEFGLGMRLTVDKQLEYAKELLVRLEETIGSELVKELLNANQSDEKGIAEQRERVEKLKAKIKNKRSAEAKDLKSLADVLVKKDVWIVGGDGWAYDIGYGGLDHVLAAGRNVNVLILDTEVYSNTGGQASKSTSLGAVAKFAAGGKATPKKDIGLMATQYGYIYVAQVAMGANDAHTVKAFREAESYDGPSLIIAYSQCIAHGINMAKGMDQQKNAVQSGYWPLYRYDPRLKEVDKNPFQLDSRAPKISFKDYAMQENRYRMLYQTNPDHADELMDHAQEIVNERYQTLVELAKKGK